MLLALFCHRAVLDFSVTDSSGAHPFVGCIAVRHIEGTIGEVKRLFVKPSYRYSIRTRRWRTPIALSLSFLIPPFN